MNLIAVRHGAIPLNFEEKLSGWIDQDLSPEGVQQAERLSQTLPGGFDTIIASPLLRAAHTARILNANHPASLVFDPNLRERNFGSLNGKTWAEAEAETGLDLRHLDVDLMQYDYRAYGGESADGVFARVRQAVHSALKLAGDKDIVLVTHGGVIKVLYSLLDYESRESITNCSVHRFHPRFK